MELIQTHDQYDRRRIFILKIDETEMRFAKLDQWNFLMLNDCAGSDKISDQLLALETIARKIERYYEETKP